VILRERGEENGFIVETWPSGRAGDRAPLAPVVTGAARPDRERGTVAELADWLVQDLHRLQVRMLDQPVVSNIDMLGRA
jgi:hypothetical protein